MIEVIRGSEHSSDLRDVINGPHGYLQCNFIHIFSLFSGKSGVAMLYLQVGREAQQNHGNLAEGTDDQLSDLNRIDFNAKGWYFSASFKIKLKVKSCCCFFLPT